MFLDVTEEAAKKHVLHLFLQRIPMAQGDTGLWIFLDLDRFDGPSEIGSEDRAYFVPVGGTVVPSATASIPSPRRGCRDGHPSPWHSAPGAAVISDDEQAIAVLVGKYQVASEPGLPIDPDYEPNRQNGRTTTTTCGRSMPMAGIPGGSSSNSRGTSPIIPINRCSSCIPWATWSSARSVADTGPESDWMARSMPSTTASGLRRRMAACLPA